MRENTRATNLNKLQKRAVQPVEQVRCRPTVACVLHISRNHAAWIGSVVFAIRFLSLNEHRNAWYTGAENRDEREGTCVTTPMTATIPLFPLDLVLFPGMELPLHIFEERYKRMMALCLRENRDFGVVLARSQTGVPGQSLTYNVGTSAHIHGATRFADGRMNLETRGERRFEIVSFHWNLEYMTGEVRWLPEDDTADFALRERAENQWNALRRRIAAITGEPITEVDLPEDPSDAAYDLAGSLPVTNTEKQMLLEATNTGTRLREAIRLIVREHGILKYTTAEHPEIPQPTEGSVIFPN